MRLTSDFWVSALTRRIFNAGGFAAVARRGSTEAGAIFVLYRSRHGRYRLFGPAPQAFYDESRPDDRAFVEILAGDDDREPTERLEREARFDPDLWLVEIESDARPEDLFSVRTP